MTSLIPQVSLKYFKIQWCVSDQRDYRREAFTTRSSALLFLQFTSRPVGLTMLKCTLDGKYGRQLPFWISVSRVYYLPLFLATASTALLPIAVTTPPAIVEARVGCLGHQRLQTAFYIREWLWLTGLYALFTQFFRAISLFSGFTIATPATRASVARFLVRCGTSGGGSGMFRWWRYLLRNSWFLLELRFHHVDLALPSKDCDGSW